MTVNGQPRDATAATVAAQAAQADRLPAEDARDFEDARRGFLGTIPDARIENARGAAVWDLAPYAFLDAQQRPDSIHPGL